MLASMHCDYGQGYLYAPALPADRAAELLPESHTWDFQNSLIGGGI